MNESKSNININELSRSQKIIRFLLDMNKLLEGLHIEEITDYNLPRLHIKFEAKLTCPYAQPGLWTPTPLFYQVLEQCCDKHFRELCVRYPNSGVNFNNTNTIFWIMEEDL